MLARALLILGSPLRTLAWVIPVVGLAWPASATGHDARPIHLRLTEIEAEVFNLTWKAPAGSVASNFRGPRLPPHCVDQQAPRWHIDSGATVVQRRVSCAGGLAGHPLDLRLPQGNPSLPTLITVEFATGERHARLLAPNEDGWTIPRRESRLTVAGQ